MVVYFIFAIYAFFYYIPIGLFIRVAYLQIKHIKAVYINDMEEDRDSLRNDDNQGNVVEIAQTATWRCLGELSVIIIPIIVLIVRLCFNKDWLDSSGYPLWEILFVQVAIALLVNKPSQEQSTPFA